MDIPLMIAAVAAFTLAYMCASQRGLWGLCPGYEVGRALYVLNWHFPIVARHVFPVVLLGQLVFLLLGWTTPLWLWAVSLGGVIGDVDYAIRPN